MGRTVAEQDFGLWEIQSQSECMCLVRLASLETQMLPWPRPGVVAPLSFLQAPHLEGTPSPSGPTLLVARPAYVLQRIAKLTLQSLGGHRLGLISGGQRGSKEDREKGAASPPTCEENTEAFVQRGKTPALGAELCAVPRTARWSAYPRRLDKPKV